MTIDLTSEGLYPPSHKADVVVRRLALSILLQAFRDVLAKPGPNRAIKVWRRDALEWFTAGDDQPGSLAWVCEILGEKPDVFRGWVKEYRGSRGEQRKELAAKMARVQLH